MYSPLEPQPPTPAEWASRIPDTYGIRAELLAPRTPLHRLPLAQRVHVILTAADQQGIDLGRHRRAVEHQVRAIERKLLGMADPD